MTGHRPFSELSERLQRRLADRDRERERIWAAIQAWEEDALPGIKFRPLAPFFDELHAIVFPDEYLTDDEISAGGASTREGGGAVLDAEQPTVERGAGAANTGAPSERQQALADVARAAIRAHRAGVPVSLHYETGQWSIGGDENSTGTEGSTSTRHAPSMAADVHDQEVSAAGAPGGSDPGTPSMCSSGDHGDVPAVGDALTDETEDAPNNTRYPYCAECLDVLGADYDAQRWDKSSTRAAAPFDPVGYGPRVRKLRARPDDTHECDDA